MSYVFEKIYYEKWLSIGNTKAVGTQMPNKAGKLQASCLRACFGSQMTSVLVPLVVCIISSVTHFPQKQNLSVILGIHHFSPLINQLDGFHLRSQERKLMTSVSSPGFPSWAACTFPQSISTCRGFAAALGIRVTFSHLDYAQISCNYGKAISSQSETTHSVVCRWENAGTTSATTWPCRPHSA